MAGYIRQSTFVDGDTITAALFNNEYNQLVNAFSNTSGHKHDGTTAEGPVIGLIGDAGETSPNNKVLIDTTNNYIEFYVEVSSAPVQQLYIADGAIIPVTDSDIDLGTTSLRFKDTYTDTVTTTGNVSIGGDLTVTGSATISGNLTFGDADTDSINLAAEIDSDIIPNTDGTYDLGSATKEWQDLYIDGIANIDSLIADTADINGGTIDGATIATSDITVGAGKTLDVSSGTLTLADDQISGDKVEGGTIAATTITTLTSTTGNITNVNATTIDSTNIEVTNLKAKDGTSAGSIADSTGVVTLASSVLTTTDINGGTIDGSTIATSDITVGTGKTLDVSAGTLTLADNQISGDKVEGGTIAATTITDLTFGSLNDGTITVTAFADEDDMSSDSATLVPTQQSVKAYVDSQVTAQDLDFQGDSGGALSIDLDSESLTIAGGTGLDTVGSGNTVTVAIDSTVATLTGTQTLTNKTLTTPIISSISNTGTLTLPTSTDTLVGRATTDTLTNKTLTSPVINTGVSGTAFLDDDTFATATASTLASSESIKAYVDTTVAATNEVVEDTTPQLGGDLDTNGNDILFADNDKAIFGAGSDLQIYSDGTDGYIDNVTGDFYIRDTTGGTLHLQAKTGEEGIVINDDGSVDLYRNNVLKMSTTSTGINVTGEVESDTAHFGTGTGTGTIIADEVVVSGTSSTGITIHSPDANNATLVFGSTTDNDYAYIQGYYNSGSPFIRTSISGSEVTKVTSSGIDVTGTVTADGLTVEGSNGNFEVATTGNSVNMTRSGNNFITASNASGDLYLGAGGTSFLKIDNGGDISFYDDTGTSQALYWDASAESLGIGTTSPSRTLDVRSAGLVTTNLQTTSTSGGLIDFKHAGTAASNAGSYNGFRFYNGDGFKMAMAHITEASGSGYLQFGTNWAAATGDVMVIHSNGNVGIGTSSPSVALEVGDGTATANWLRLNGTTSDLYIGQNTGFSHFGQTNATKILSVSNHPLVYGTANAYPLIFGTSDTERMRIDSSGNVGIGTSSPSAKLHVEVADNTEFLRATISGNEDWAFKGASGSGATDYVSFGIAGGTQCMTWQEDGKVGIGTSSPTRTFEVNSGTTNVVARFESTDSRAVAEFKDPSGSAELGNIGNDIYFAPAGAEKMRIDTSGNLLVGRTSSVGKVDIESSKGTQLYINGLTGVSNFILFDFNGSTVGSITTNGVTTAYNTSSDARLKDVTGEARGLEVINELNPVSYNWKADGKADEGLIAQEVQEIVPNAVTGSEEDYYQMDYSKLVVHLVKAVKEQQAQIEALQSEINELKNS